MNGILTNFSGVIVNTITVLIGSGVVLGVRSIIKESFNIAVMIAIGF